MDAICTVEKVGKQYAHCTVMVRGSVLSVEMPTAMLQAKGITKQFKWRMPRDGELRAEDLFLVDGTTEMF